MGQDSVGQSRRPIPRTRMRTEHHDHHRATRRPLLSAWLLVFAMLLQPLTIGWSGPTCDAAGDCCCSGTEPAPEAARSGCCASATPTHAKSEPALQPDGCGCTMEPGTPIDPLICTPATVAPADFGLTDLTDLGPLPISLVGGGSVTRADASIEDGSPPANDSLLVRRLQSGGLNAHLARLAVARL